ncbi:uncharacterized protein LOC135928537 [Gordionus sp. m RMFG-2023]|uniref:uncharacterized protein LOC135928537 n=1 Tax=Gordionus sp. m RMFG-2023 TaxID=3053472 RepID=UPI0031FC2065
MKENRIYDVYKKLKHFCKSGCFMKLPMIVLENGKPITDQDEQMALWLDHYMSVFDSRKATLLTTMNSHTIVSPVGFSSNEISNIVKKLRNNRAPGLDNITAEYLKISPNTISSFLLALFNKIWESGKTPTEWNKSLLCNFPKIKKPMKFADYSAVALTSCVSKKVNAAADLADFGFNENFHFVNRIVSYADDIVVISKNIEETVSLIHLIKTISLRVGLKINFNKTVILPSPNTPSLQNLLVGGNVIKKVDNIKYLGVMLNNKGECKEEMKIRTQKAKRAFYMYMKIWKTKEISVFTRLRLFNSTIIPILLYGSDIWEANKTDLRRIQSFINNCLRTINGIFYPRVISNSNL